MVTARAALPARLSARRLWHERVARTWPFRSHARTPAHAGTRMMAVKFKEQPPEPTHFRGKVCCKEVRDYRGEIRTRNAALQVAQQAINDTKDALADQILAAEQPIYELNLAFNNSRDDLADATENYNTACDARENADQEYNRLSNVCRQPQPPPNCEADKQAALRAANTANATAVSAKATMDAGQRLNNEDKERLNAAQQHLLDVEKVRDDDVKVCEEDRIDLDNKVAEAQKKLDDAVKLRCPGNCPGWPPPPPTLVPGDVVQVVGSDDGVNFWTLSGMVKSEMTRSLYVDFKPKGGPFNFNGTYADDGDIVWQDENRWQKRKVLKADTLHNSDSIGGLYLEPELAEPGTLKGMRMIAEVAESTTLTVVGTVRHLASQLPASPPSSTGTPRPLPRLPFVCAQ
jgi:hypothetical protein